MQRRPPLLDRISDVAASLGVLRKSGLLAPMRPDKYAAIVAAARREGSMNTVGMTLSARRWGNHPALIDERGVLSYCELDSRIAALASALARLPGGPPGSVGIMCRNHRGFVETVSAANRIGADTVLLNTSFAGPALGQVVERERPDVLVYDEEFVDTIDQATAAHTGIARIVAWAEDQARHPLTIEDLIASCAGDRPPRAVRKARLVLLTSGTTGTPKGARRGGGGGIHELAAVLSRVPWRTKQTVVVVAPMFHAWGFAQLVLGSLMSCTLVLRRRFDAEATLALVDRHGASGLSVVPVMLDRIMDLPNEVLDRYSGHSLRFVTASGSRMRADVVTGFMDRFGDVVYNNYNATEAGMITTASPADLRAAADTAGRPLSGVDIRILDEHRNDVPRGSVGQIFARTSTKFDAYTSGDNKSYHEGYMASGDLGYIDNSGLLFIVGRDDEMIVSGGENVYPIEVEKALISHPEVVEAAVLGVDDDKFGQRLVGFVVCHDRPSAVSAEQLKAHVRETLANFKVPREIYFLDQLPRSGTGKLVRSQLREHLAAAEGL